MTGIVIYALIFLGLLYLYALNMLLRGRLTPIIEGALGLLCMGMLVVSFFVFGWRSGIGMILLALVAIPIAKALAVPAVHRLLGYRTGFGEFSAMEGDLERLMSGQLSVEQYFEKDRKRQDKASAMLAQLAERPEIAFVLEKNHISNDGYLVLYWDLMTHALPDLVWDILGNPEKLQKLIDLKSNGTPWLEVRATFREYR